MKVIVGLGNPGVEYERTRHNVGFWVVDELQKKLGAPKFESKPKFQVELTKHGELLLVKPQTYMNRSGQAVRAVLDFFGGWEPVTGGRSLFVAHDDLDIPVGSCKLQFGTGPKVHNGLLSLYEHVGVKNFWHVRVGVDGRDGDRSIPPDRYVLQGPSTAEESAALAVGIHEAVEKIIAHL